VCITINQPDTKSNPNINRNPTTKQHAVASIQLNIVTYPNVSIEFHTRQCYCAVCTAFRTVTVIPRMSCCPTRLCCNSGNVYTA